VTDIGAAVADLLFLLYSFPPPLPPPLPPLPPLPPPPPTAPTDDNAGLGLQIRSLPSTKKVTTACQLASCRVSPVKPNAAAASSRPGPYHMMPKCIHLSIPWVSRFVPWLQNSPRPRACGRPRKTPALSQRRQRTSRKDWGCTSTQPALRPDAARVSAA